LRKKCQISINEKKKFKRIPSCLFGGRQKVQVTKFAFEDFIFLVGSAANLVSTTLEFAAALTPNIAELVPFYRQPWFLQQSNHIFPGKTPPCSCR